jgi:hypothetical protein
VTMAHTDHRFSITIYTDDLAVVNCLRALSKLSQKTGNNNIPWGATKDRNWKRAEYTVVSFLRSGISGRVCCRDQAILANKPLDGNPASPAK